MLKKIITATVLASAFLFGSLAMAQTIYTTHGDGTRLGTIDAVTGAGTDVGATGQSAGWGLARGSDGTLYTTYDGFSGNAQLATINSVTGAIDTTIGGLGVSLIALEIDGNGQLWGVGYNNGILYRINKATAEMTAVGETGVGYTMDLSFDPAGNLYSNDGANVLYQLNPFTGASSVAANITGIVSGAVMGIMHDANGTLFATAYEGSSPLYEIDLVTGVATSIGGTGFYRPHGGDIESESAPRAPAPVPTMSAYGLALTVFGLMLLGVMSLRTASKRS